MPNYVCRPEQGGQTERSTVRLHLSFGADKCTAVEHPFSVPSIERFPLSDQNVPFSLHMSMPAMNSELTRIITDLRSLKLGMGSEPIGEPELITHDHAHEESIRISELMDRSAIQTEIERMLTLLVFVSRDARHLADWSIVTDREVRKTQTQLKALAGKTVQFDLIDPLGDDIQHN